MALNAQEEETQALANTIKLTHYSPFSDQNPVRKN
jgi:hypothetical protein